MKRFAMLAATVAAFFSFALLAGCATSSTDAASQVKTAVATACTVTQTAVAAIQAADIGSTQLQTDLTTYGVVLTTVCAENATLDTASLETLVNTGIPALIADIDVSALPDSTKAKLVAGLTIANVAITSVLAQYTSAEAATITPTATSPTTTTTTAQ